MNLNDFGYNENKDLPNVGEQLTTEEIEKKLYKAYCYEGKIWTPLSYLEVKA